MEVIFRASRNVEVTKRDNADICNHAISVRPLHAFENSLLQRRDGLTLLASCHSVVVENDKAFVTQQFSLFSRIHLSDFLQAVHGDEIVGTQSPGACSKMINQV